jgi:hypothetical protein
MRAPLHRRTEKIGACLADPFANGEGAERSDTFTIPKRGAGGGCIDPLASLKRDYRHVNENMRSIFADTATALTYVL